MSLGFSDRARAEWWPQRYVHVLVSGIVNLTLSGKRCDCVKDHEKRNLSYIIHVGPAHGHLYSHKRELEGAMTQKRRKSGKKERQRIV